MKQAIIIIAAMLFTAGASAQEAKNTHEKQHSLEITTGYPSIIFNAEYPWTYRRVELSQEGKQLKEHFQPGINFGYTYSWRKRWELNAMVNVHLTISDISQYPMVHPEDSRFQENVEYDWDADPLSTERKLEVFGAVSAAFRYKWIVREGFDMYSALGLGISAGFPIPLPYIAPVGIKFGKGKVYGLAELNMTPITTFGMAGIGIRL